MPLHADRPFGRATEFEETAARVSNWARWGEDDERGTLNFITADLRRAAAGLVLTGKVFDLSMPLDRLGPQSGGARFNPMHIMTALPRDATLAGNGFYTDDMIIMPLQAATQWDALAHVGYDEMIYNGAPMDSVTVNGATRNSIATVAAQLIGRGVLLDIPRHRSESILQGGYEITADDLASAAAAQRTEVGTGDIVLVRTGWYQHFARGDSVAYLAPPIPGIGMGAAEWLHDREVAAVASDTFIVEVRPSRVDGVHNPVHMLLLRDVGMMLGEMFNLEDLAADCAGDQIWEFWLNATALKVSGGVGSPLTPVAIK